MSGSSTGTTGNATAPATASSLGLSMANLTSSLQLQAQQLAQRTQELSERTSAVSEITHTLGEILRGRQQQQQQQQQQLQQQLSDLRAEAAAAAAAAAASEAALPVVSNDTVHHTTQTSTGGDQDDFSIGDSHSSNADDQFFSSDGDHNQYADFIDEDEEEDEEEGYHEVEYHGGGFENYDDRDAQQYLEDILRQEYGCEIRPVAAPTDEGISAHAHQENDDDDDDENREGERSEEDHELALRHLEEDLQAAAQEMRDMLVSASAAYASHQQLQQQHYQDLQDLQQRREQLLSQELEDIVIEDTELHQGPGNPHEEPLMSPEGVANKDESRFEEESSSHLSPDAQLLGDLLHPTLLTGGIGQSLLPAIMDSEHGDLSPFVNLPNAEYVVFLSFFLLLQASISYDLLCALSSISLVDCTTILCKAHTQVPRQHQPCYHHK